MSRNRDIERVLDTWFVEGPSVMPDRLMLGVLDQVERTPQRRLSRLTLRLSEMSPRLRMLTAAAAAIVVAVVGFALINRAPVNNIGPSSSPTATSSAGPTFDPAIPGSMLGRWQSGTRDEPGIDPGAGTSILIGPGTIEFAQSNDIDRPRITSTIGSVGSNRLAVQTVGDADDCPLGSAGEYSWQLSPGGKTLELAVVEETCANRQAALPGTWLFEDCPIEDEGCLGPLEGGTYGSQFFDPFVAAGATWHPRFGVLTYTAPAGWSNAADWPDTFELVPAAGLTGGIYLVDDIVAASTDAPCGEMQQPGVGETAEALATWLATVPALDVTAPAQVQLGTLDAWRMDIALAPTWTTTCEFSDEKPYHGLFVDRLAGSGFAWGIREGGRMRLYLADLGDGRALMISIESTIRADFDAMVGEATAIVESFKFVP